MGLNPIAIAPALAPALALALAPALPQPQALALESQLIHYYNNYFTVTKGSIN